MPIVQTRNASMQQLNSADALDVDNNNFGAEWYDHAGGQAVSLGSGTFTLNLDTEKINSAPTVFVMASDILTITEAGLYLFAFKLMVTSNGNAVHNAWLEQDPDTGTFTILFPAEIFFPTANGINSPSSGSVTSLVQVGINYRYRIRYQQNAGSTPATTVVDGSSLCVVRLFKNG